MVNFDLSYTWATRAEKSLAIMRTQDNERNRSEFIDGCLAQPTFRQKEWKDELTERPHLEVFARYGYLRTMERRMRFDL